MQASSHPLAQQERGVLIAMGERIRLARLRRKLSMRLVAARAGVSRSTLYAVEAGEPTCALGTYFRVLAVLSLERDFEKIAADDSIGRELQDLQMLPSMRSRPPRGFAASTRNPQKTPSSDQETATSHRHAEQMPHHLDRQTEHAVSRFASIIASRYDMAGIIVYGSRARGTHRQDSDADVAVLLHGEHLPFLPTKLEMADAAFDVSLETGILISPLPVWLDEWEHPEDYSNPALLRNIDKEGVRFWTATGN